MQFSYIFFENSILFAITLILRDNYVGDIRKVSQTSLLLTYNIVCNRFYNLDVMPMKLKIKAFLALKCLIIIIDQF